MFSLGVRCAVSYLCPSATMSSPRRLLEIAPVLPPGGYHCIRVVLGQCPGDSDSEPAAHRGHSDSLSSQYWEWGLSPFLSMRGNFERGMFVVTLRVTEGRALWLLVTRRLFRHKKEKEKEELKMMWYNQSTCVSAIAVHGIYKSKLVTDI